MESYDYWDVMPCSPLKISCCFGGVFWFLAWLAVNATDGGDMFLQNSHFHQNIWHCISEDRTRHTFCCCLFEKP
jgi:hypothetical protein